MYCSQCGKQILEDARFCMYCGSSTSSDSQVSGGGYWETCEIQEKAGKGNKVCFFADAIGRNGRFVAGESASWKIRADGGFFREIVSAYTFGLVSDGDAEYRSSGWFNDRYELESITCS